MKPLIDRIAEARDVAADRESDIRIQEFLLAITVVDWQSALGIGAPSHTPDRLEVSIDCHSRSWHKSVRAEEAAQLAILTPDQLAQTIAGWVQEAIKQGLLLLSNPPRDRAVDSAKYAVGGVFTYIYGSDGDLVGARWGGG